MNNRNNEKFRIGIDLGGTNIKVGFITQDNKIIETDSTPTLVNREWQEVVADIVKLIHEIAKKSNTTLDNCLSVGMGSPGMIDTKNGVVVYSANFPTWKNIPICQELNKLLNKPVKISNDANCAALGEFVAGAAKEFNSTVLLTLGTGVGGGVVYEGKILEGGIGGMELGHVVQHVDGELCNCGRRGCLEMYCSASALIRFAKKAAKENPNSLLNKLCDNDMQKMNGIIPFEAAKKNDEAALAVIQNYIKNLGEGIANMVNIFRPEIILISGGICNEKEYLTDPLNDFLRKNIYGGNLQACPEVRTATLRNFAGMVGAANLY